MDNKRLQGSIESAKEGDETAFNHLMNLTGPFSRSIARRYVTNPTDQEDLLQDAWLKIWKNLNNYEPSRPFLSWIQSIIRNTAIDWYRKQKKRFVNPMEELPAPDQFLSDSLLDYQDLLSIVQHWLPTLPEIQQRVFILRDLDNLSTRDVQEETGLSESSVKTNLYLVRKQLRQHLIKLGYRNK